MSIIHASSVISASLRVLLEGGSISATRVGSGTATATYSLSFDGTESGAVTPSGTVDSALPSTWLRSGAYTDYWFERTIDSGTLDTDDSGAGRFQLPGTGQYDWAVSRSTNGVDTAQITMEIWSASTGGVLLASAVINLSAEVTV